MVIYASALKQGRYGEVAQLARACGSYPQCRGFKSPSRYAKNKVPIVRLGSYFLCNVNWTCFTDEIHRKDNDKWADIDNRLFFDGDINKAFVNIGLCDTIVLR